MTKKLISLLLSSLLILGCLGVSAAADTAEPEVLAVYRTENKLYSFLSVDENNTVKFKGSDAELGGNLAEPKRILEGEYGATYIVLLDITESMEDYKDDVKAFLSGLLENKVWSSRMILVPYVSSPHLNSVTDTIGMSREEAIEAINNFFDSIGYINADNYAYSSIAELVDYLNTDCHASAGDLINLILITDSVDENKGSKAVDAARDKLKSSPELLFHTILFSNKKSVDSKLDGMGMNLTVNKELDAKSAAKKMVSTLSEVHRIALPWVMAEQTVERDTVEWYLQFWHEAAVSTRIVKMENVALLVQNESGQLHVIGHEVVTDIPDEMPDEDAVAVAESESESGPKDQQSAAEENPDSVKPDGEAAEENPDSEEPVGEEPEEAPDEENAENSEDGEVIPAQGDEKPGLSSLKEKLNDRVVIILIAAIAVLLVIIVVLIVCAGRKKVKPNAYSIFMQLEVLSGKCTSKKREFYLTDELLIGTSRKCDVIFKEAEMSATNTRVFMKDGFIFVADLNSERGTAVEGMRIFSPNRLRSGEQISVGSVRFRFYF